MFDYDEASGSPPKTGPNMSKNSPAMKGKSKGKGKPADDKALPPWMNKGQKTKKGK